MRFQIIAYVCDGGEVKYNRHEGAAEIMQALVNRPDKCRYIVAKVGDEYWAMDLYDLRYDPQEPNYADLAPGHYTTHQTENAAIVAALLTYERS